ncbi:uncharacterized protein Z518_09091 [Rhinocladiella mackenziei CBS 650.93]|uniref:Uncharacterized protein n=1 Tax=Rhinocladiella mackenziei CBS 650.93 TaxID=1442369 RepID=A0A0D2IDP5_9EURO|nr:uncharacterized protein Z518_09091 [Rhinocladiella mackenziei CBS 650.93]KIX01366.1 hypothetical protein Z518_09091 [Rhinocladiella mackenziei CBS 650.93]
MSKGRGAATMGTFQPVPPGAMTGSGMGGKPPNDPNDPRNPWNPPNEHYVPTTTLHQKLLEKMKELTQSKPGKPCSTTRWSHTPQQSDPPLSAKQWRRLYRETPTSYRDRQVRSLLSRPIARELEYWGDRNFKNNHNHLGGAMGYTTGYIEDKPCDHCRDSANMTSQKEPVFPECVSALRYPDRDEPNPEFLLRGGCATCYLKGTTCSLSAGRRGYDEPISSPNPNVQPASAPTPQRRSQRKRVMSPAVSPDDDARGAIQIRRTVQGEDTSALFTPDRQGQTSGPGVLAFAGDVEGERLEFRAPAFRTNDERTQFYARVVAEAARALNDPDYTPGQIQYRRISPPRSRSAAAPHASRVRHEVPPSTPSRAPQSVSDPRGVFRQGAARPQQAIRAQELALQAGYTVWHDPNYEPTPATPTAYPYDVPPPRSQSGRVPPAAQMPRSVSNVSMKGVEHEGSPGGSSTGLPPSVSGNRHRSLVRRSASRESSAGLPPQLGGFGQTSRRGSQGGRGALQSIEDEFADDGLDLGIDVGDDVAREDDEDENLQSSQHTQHSSRSRRSAPSRKSGASKRSKGGR